MSWVVTASQLEAIGQKQTWKQYNNITTTHNSLRASLGVAMVERSASLRNRPQTADALRKHRPDYWLLVIVACLLALGLVVVYSISPALSELRGGNFVAHQVVAIALSIVAFIITSRIPLSQWQRWQWWLLGVAAVGTLIALITPPIPAYPQHRWIRLGSFSLQSVEVLKFALLVAISGFLANHVRQNTIGNYKRH
ncbi:FtsW/RodA/SpoVE family cell cycle protein [Candidatus Saccharibacteria bacterium]|nr:MAG: FtsW/RodA/SpoVE family cell cycle protein [Candidatus Saccharibacteria bacterium]